MNKDTFTTLLRDGNAFADILMSVTEDKQILMRAMVNAYIDGMIAQERITEQVERAGA